MEEQREESEFVGDYREPMEEVGKGLGLSSKTETLVVEDANTLEVSDFGVCDENPNDGGSATEVGNTDNLVSDEEQVKADVESVEDTVDSVTAQEPKDNVERTDAITEPETERDDMDCDGDAGEDETVTSGGNEVSDDKAKRGVEDNGGACDVEQNVQTDKSQQRSVDGETLSVAEADADQEKGSSKESHENSNKMEQGNSGCETSAADQEKELAKNSEEDNNKMDVDSKEAKEENVGLNEQRNPRSETSDAKHSESAKVPGTVSEFSSAAEIIDEENITNVNQKEENGEAMEIDYAEEQHVENDVKVGGALDNASNKTVGASVVETQEILANPNSPSEDAAPGEVEPLDENALFDPSSDITNFIDFSGVSSWSGNIQDLKTETRNVSLKEDKKATGMAEDIVTVGIENESNEARVAFGAESPAAATDCSKEASDATLGSEKKQEDKDHECLDKKMGDKKDTMREEVDITHEASSIEPKQKEDTEMEENPNNSDIKTNGVKRKADVLSEDSSIEGRKTVSLAKVSFAERPSFKIGACIARAASQMAGSSSVLKGSNFDDETLSVESFVSQLHCAATDPVKDNVVSDIAAGFFLDFRNSSALQQVIPEKVSNKRGRPSNSNAGGTEAFEFEEMGDTYWTDRVIHNGGEEQTPPTEKGNYQVVPVELKPSHVQRTRRPYRRRQAQINIPHSASEKPANVDENAPAELVMNFSEADTIPPETSLSKMFRHFGPIRESQTEVDKENNRARVVYRKGVDAEVAYNSAGRFSIFGTKTVNYELSYTITETFKVRPYVVSLGEEDAALCLPS